MPDPQFTVDTGVTMNNRTLNFSSAAEPENDAFFDMMLSEKYGRRFPATSSVQTWIRFGMPNGGRVYLDWTPFHWCVNGTVSGCANVLGDDGGTGSVTACGPVYVSDGSSPDSWSAESMDGASIQGACNVVVSGFRKRRPDSSADCFFQEVAWTDSLPPRR